MSETPICTECNKPFRRGQRPNQVVCSRDCQDERKRRLSREKKPALIKGRYKKAARV